MLCPAAKPVGESAQAVTVLAVGGVVQVPAVVAGVVTGNGPSSRLATVTVCATSGARPTAPFHVNEAAAVPPDPGAAPLLAPSLVAGSPGTSVPGETVLK